MMLFSILLAFAAGYMRVEAAMRMQVLFMMQVLFIRSICRKTSRRWKILSQLSRLKIRSYILTQPMRLWHI